MTRAHATKPLVKQIRCVIYVRISRDPANRRLGVDRQEEACRVVANAYGWQVVKVFTDNDESAGKEKDPPQYRAMIAFLEAGLADAIVVTKVDRLHRQLWKFAVFMRWLKQHKLKFATIEGDDTETASGMTTLGIKASLAEGEWLRVQERVRDAVRQRVTRGRANGGNVPYYVAHPDAIPWVQQAATDVLNGRSLHALAKEWNAQDRRTATNQLWTPRAIRRMLLSPSIIGKQELNGTLYLITNQPAILEEEVWSAVVTFLTAPDRRKHEVNQRKYMLSGLCKCAALTEDGQVCGNNLTSTGKRVTTRRGAEVTDLATFECSKWKTSGGGCGKVKIVMAPLEAYITEAVFHALDSRAFHRALAEQQQSTGTQTTDLQGQITRDQAALVSLANEKDDGLITDEAEYKRRRTRITDRLTTTQDQLIAMRQQNRRASLPTGDELEKAWPGYDAAKRREIVSAVIERVDVSPHPRGVSSAPPRRSQEPLEAWRARFDAVRMATMADRTVITWWA